MGRGEGGGVASIQRAPPEFVELGMDESKNSYLCYNSVMFAGT